MGKVIMIKKAIKILFCILILITFCGVNSSVSRAESQNACAIWLCLPAGFPQGCSGAYGEFKHRIKKGRPPLPPLSSCSNGPNGETTNGRYTLGYEQFEPCKGGYTLKTYGFGGYGRSNNLKGACYLNRCVSRIGTAIPNDYRCENYIAKKRPKPSFVKMWVDGKYLGQFFY